MRTLLTTLPLALMLAACMTPYGQDPYGQSGYPPQGYPDPGYPQPYPDPNYPPQGYPDQGYPVPPGANDYRASGTEPFWDLTIGRDMVFADRGTGLELAQVSGTLAQVQPADAGAHRAGTDQDHLATTLAQPNHLVGERLNPLRIEPALRASTRNAACAASSAA